MMSLTLCEKEGIYMFDPLISSIDNYYQISSSILAPPISDIINPQITVESD
jgi:hypothetical protein